MSERTPLISRDAVVGVLLAGGAATRFGSNKLLHPLADGTPVAVAALRPLLTVLKHVFAVVRSGDPALHDLLQNNGAEVIDCADCHAGMGHSIATGVRASADAAGWLIALADMPFVSPGTITSVAKQLASGAAISVPVVRGRQGHPVGFAKQFLPALTSLNGDHGARSVIQAHVRAVEFIPCDDPGAVRDVDTQSDLIG